MKRIINCMAVCVVLLAFNQSLFAQKSGKYYMFSVEGNRTKKGKMNVKYNSKDGTLKLKKGGFSVSMCHQIGRAHV